MTLTGATTRGQSGPGSNGNEGVLLIPQSSKAGASPSDGLVSYLGPSLRCSQCILQPQATGLTNDRRMLFIINTRYV